MTVTVTTKASVVGDLRTLIPDFERSLAAGGPAFPVFTPSQWLLLLAGIAIVVALRSPGLGFDLVLGGGCGVANMLLIMRNNERLLDGRRSRGVYGLNNVVRVLGVGVLPAIAALTGPAWTLVIAYAGFFTPLVSYAIVLRNAYRRGT